MQRFSAWYKIVASLRSEAALVTGVPAHTAQWLNVRQVATVSKEESLKLVKLLRAQTGAPIGDVRAALKEAEYDVSTAFDVLRKKGAAAAAKKSDREALQVSSLGCICLAASRRSPPGGRSHGNQCRSCPRVYATERHIQHAD